MGVSSACSVTETTHPRSGLYFRLDSNLSRLRTRRPAGKPSALPSPHQGPGLIRTGGHLRIEGRALIPSSLQLSLPLVSEQDFHLVTCPVSGVHITAQAIVSSPAHSLLDSAPYMVRVVTSDTHIC